jgi:anaerobic magnesium-protoporphyrin IX monomethyl ester cyclase
MPDKPSLLLIGPHRPESSESSWNAPHLGLQRLAAWLRLHGYPRVRVYDVSVEGPIEDRLYGSWDFIGFSPLADTLPQDVANMRQAAKVNPSAVLIAGGVEATLNYQEILENAPVTWIALGMGENALLGILRGDNPLDIPGVVFRRYANPTTGDDLWRYYEAMDFSQLGYERYWDAMETLYENPDVHETRTVRLVTSTHCNRGCTFCSVTQWNRVACGKMARPSMLNAGQVLSLVERVKREVPKAETIFFCEDDFCMERARVETFVERSAELGVTYLVQTHSEQIDKELIGKLARGGCRHISLGIESASPAVLREFRKPQDLARVPSLIRWCREVGIVPYLLIILFSPETTLDDLRLNVRTLRRWQEIGGHLSMEAFTIPYRGAPLNSSLHDFQYKRTQLDSHTWLKSPTVILPDDPVVRALMLRYRDEWAAYLAGNRPKHYSKSHLGKMQLDLLQKLMLELP